MGAYLPFAFSPMPTRARLANVRSPRNSCSPCPLQGCGQYWSGLAEPRAVLDNCVRLKRTRVTKNAACPEKGGMEMVEALQINFALWGMIVCAVIKISQLAAAV